MRYLSLTVLGVNGAFAGAYLYDILTDFWHR